MLTDLIPTNSTSVANDVESTIALPDLYPHELDQED